MQGDGPPLPLHCVSRVARIYRDDEWLDEEEGSAASGDDRRAHSLSHQFTTAITCRLSLQALETFSMSWGEQSHPFVSYCPG
jgi:hypothetical protein